MTDTRIAPAAEAPTRPTSPPPPLPEHERLEEPVESAAEPEARARGWAPPRSGIAMTLLFVLLLVAGVLIALRAWGLAPFTSAVQTTDNAYVRGQTTIIAPQVNG